MILLWCQAPSHVAQTVTLYQDDRIEFFTRIYSKQDLYTNMIEALAIFYNDWLFETCNQD